MYIMYEGNKIVSGNFLVLYVFYSFLGNFFFFIVSGC